MHSRLTDPRLLVVSGALTISFSSLFVALSGASPADATVWRALLGLVVLVPLGVWEFRRKGISGRWPAEFAAGALLGGDFLLWTQSIADVGAGIAMVLVNVQVVITPLFARLTGERISARFLVVLPFAMAGVALASGITAPSGHTVRGTLCGLGAGLCYAGYLTVMRRSGSHKFTPVATATVGTLVTGLVAGLVIGGVSIPGWPAMGWLIALALGGQVIGWLLASWGIQNLPATVGASLLLLQPLLGIVWGVVVLGEQLTAWQVLGCAIVLASLWLVAGVRPRRARRAAKNPERADQAVAS